MSDPYLSLVLRPEDLPRLRQVLLDSGDPYLWEVYLSLGRLDHDYRDSLEEVRL